MRALRSLSEASPELVTLFDAAEQRGRVCVLQLLIAELRADPAVDVLSLLEKCLIAEERAAVLAGGRRLH